MKGTAIDSGNRTEIFQEVPARPATENTTPAAPSKADMTLPVGARLIVFGIVYFVLAKVSMWLFAAYPANIALLWLPAGFGLYIYARWGAGVLAAIFIAGFVASFPSMVTETLWRQVFHTAVSAGADTLFAFVAGGMLNRRLAGAVREPAQLFDFILYCCFLPLLLSTLLIAGNLWLGGYMPRDMAALTGVAIFIGDFLGVLLVYPLLPAWEHRHREAPGVSGMWIVASLFSLGFVLASFFVAHWLLYFCLPALIYIVIGAKPLYAYISLSATIFLYNALAAQLRDFSVASGPWLEVLALSCAVTLAVLAMSIQQRSLLNERNLRERWRMTANHDALTQLPNRSYIRLLAQHEITRLKRDPGTFCLALLDIDDFKQINDTYGHSAGDTVLVELANRLQNAFRESDVVSRYGGEEFLVMLLNARLPDARQLVERIREEVATTPFLLGDVPITITFSAGVAEYHPENQDTLGQLINNADKRMYAAKRRGRNRVAG